MTQEEIIAGNKRIAEFMGVIPVESQEEHDKMNDLGKGDRVWWLQELKYHASWDWLMPVVEKIERTLPDDNIVIISFKHCEIEDMENESTFESVGKTKIEAVYRAVCEFILFRKNKKPQTNPV